jgi:hypothetical protein
MSKTIKLFSILLLLTMIISCNELKKDNSHNFLSNCGDKIDSTKSLKLKIGSIDNLDILNGIKCFEFNNSIDQYKKLGKYIKHEDYEEILFDDDYCFNYRNICWRKTRVIFFKGKLSIIELFSDLSVQETNNLSIDFSAFFGKPQINLESSKFNTKDTICLGNINNIDFKTISENENKGIENKNEILLGTVLENNNKGFDKIELNVLKGTEVIKKMKNSLIHFEIHQLIYNYNKRWKSIWKSNSIFEITFNRNNPFRTIPNSSENNMPLKFGAYKVVYSPNYSVNISFYKDSLSQNKIHDIYATQTAKEIFNIIRNIDSSHNNKIEEFKKSF